MNCKGESDIEDYIFIWLSMIKDLNYLKVIRLLKAFNSLENLFNISKNRLLFRNVLVQNSLKISNDCFNDFINANLRRDAKLVYDNLVNQGFKFISIFSNNYPLELKSCINAPLILFCYGDIKLLLSKEKKIFIYKREENIRLYNDICSDILKNNKVIFVNDINSLNSVIIEKEDILNIDYKYLKNECYFESNSKNSTNRLYVIIPIKADYLYELLSAVTDYLLILKSDFNKEIYRLSQNILDFGKDILVIPGSIYDKSCYFSNYLLKEGATVILNKKDLNSMF